MRKEFVDGPGLASPGRWKVRDQRLPDYTLALDLRMTMFQGLLDLQAFLTVGSLRAAMLVLGQGDCKASPFPEEALEDIRTSLRRVLRTHGKSDGPPRKGDAAQTADVRLIQTLLDAFGDPDTHSTEWWARAVWLGSPERPLPRAPPLYNRKTKWAVKDEGMTLHGD